MSRRVASLCADDLGRVVTVTVDAVPYSGRLESVSHYKHLGTCLTISKANAKRPSGSPRLVGADDRWRDWQFEGFKPDAVVQVDS